MKKTILTTSILTLLAGSIYADWQYSNGKGDGYSYDSNGIYTDSRGYGAIGIEGSHTVIQDVDYSNKSYVVNATTSSNSDFVNTKMALSGEYQDAVFGIYNSTVKDSNFSGSSFTGTSIYDQHAMYVSASASLENVNFSNSLFSSKVMSNINSGFTAVGTLKDINFSNSTFESFGSFCENITFRGNVENINLSGITSKGFKEATDSFIDHFGEDIKDATSSSIGFYANAKNINLNNSKHNALKGIAIWSGSNVENLTAQNAEFKNVDMGSDKIVYGSGTLKNADFRGATLTAFGSEETVAITAENISDYSTLKNVMLSDGTIFSTKEIWSTENAGLILAEGETFTVSKYESPVATFSTEGNDISAKLTVDSTLNGGTIVLEDGALLEISEGVTLTLSDTVEFVVADGVSDVSEVLSLGENSTIVMAGYTDAEASNAFANLFKSEDGSSLEFTTPESFVIKGSEVPEPSTYAIIFGAIALGFVAYRRRK